LMEKNNNQFKLERDEYLGAARQDLTKLRQSLFNLLSNAAKFTHEGTVTLQASRAKSGDGDWLSFTISDTGIGIRTDKLGQVFEEFTQADESTTRDYGGTGLGLAISKRFCRMMGGDITVRSQPGEGSAFTIRIPAIAPAASLPQTPAKAAPVKTQAELDAMLKVAPGCMVLVIDDDAEAREIIERFLKKDGFEVMTAASGEEGLRIAHRVKPAAITLDVMMPDMDGWSVLRALKADPNLQNIPVVMVTMVDDKTKGYSLGATDYLTKPVNRDKLHKILSRYHCADDVCAVLVVEDDEKTRDIMARTLEKEDWDVMQAGNGREALEQMSQIKPDLILLDLMMPVMDGFDFRIEMRGNPAWKDIPVIVVTAKDLTADDRRILSGKVEQVLEKGAYSQQQLLAMVHSVVAKSDT
ncbi:MAG: response regulator, partial [Gammaproteobacteria bacterium]